mgnify:CR=1 FL=1
MSLEDAAKEAAERILAGDVPSAAALRRLKLELCGKHRVPVLRNSQILLAIPEKRRTREIVRLLRVRGTRTISGVTPIAVMTPPKGSCPYHCTYCPTSDSAPKSYTGMEPSAMRAIQNGYDPFLIVRNRIAHLEAIGHDTSKCELIFQGGTYNARAKEEQELLVKRALDAMNETESASLEQALALNETAPHRAVGITFETRPDWCTEEHVDEFLRMGATRIELGVQTLDEDVLRRVRRGHGVAEVVAATRVLKDSALKVLYHMMPGLHSTAEKDEEYFRTLFSDQRFMPDMLKIYPLLVLPGTEIYEEWKRGEIRPYVAEEAAEVIANASRHIPRWCRVMRINRDIPSTLVAAGVRKSNLRQLVEEAMARKGTKCECIRCREVGIVSLKKGIEPDHSSAELRRIDYTASGGKEIFLSLDEPELDALFGFVRLRIPGNPHRSEIGPGTVLIRELHVYGYAVGIGEKAADSQSQHRGFGERLLSEAERIAREEFGGKKSIVIAGAGAKPYYRRLGYTDDGPYLSKELRG